MHNDSELSKLVRLSAAHFLDTVMDANSIFVQLYNIMYYGENRTPSLDYDLAESFVLWILIISILGGYALGIYVGRNWKKFTTE